MGEVAEKHPVYVVVSKDFTNIDEFTLVFYRMFLVKCYGLQVIIALYVRYIHRPIETVSKRLHIRKPVQSRPIFKPSQSHLQVIYKPLTNPSPSRSQAIPKPSPQRTHQNLINIKTSSRHRGHPHPRSPGLDSFQLPTSNYSIQPTLIFRGRGQFVQVQSKSKKANRKPVRFAARRMQWRSFWCLRRKVACGVWRAAFRSRLLEPRWKEICSAPQKLVDLEVDLGVFKTWGRERLCKVVRWISVSVWGLMVELMPSFMYKSIWPDI
jgi:hypothetical protein